MPKLNESLIELHGKKRERRQDRGDKKLDDEPGKGRDFLFASLGDECGMEKTKKSRPTKGKLCRFWLNQASYGGEEEGETIGGRDVLAVF